ncbi:MAG: flagellar biosynthesis protein FlgG [Desulfovibrionaceae bacterium]|nr:flagellar biosynthesis protein FlgG [Desulfovibrionaceae bacterium]
MDVNLQALSALGVSMAVTANNVANVNTNEFQSSRAYLETGPEGQGVRVSGVFRDESPGALVEEGVPVRGEDGVWRAETEYVEAGNTDPAREAVSMIVDQRAFTANVAAVRSWDQTTGALLDMIA